MVREPASCSTEDSDPSPSVSSALIFSADDGTFAAPTPGLEVVYAASISAAVTLPSAFASSLSNEVFAPAVYSAAVILPSLSASSRSSFSSPASAAPERAKLPTSAAIAYGLRFFMISLQSRDMRDYAAGGWTPAPFGAVGGTLNRKVRFRLQPFLQANERKASPFADV